MRIAAFAQAEAGAPEEEGSKVEEVPWLGKVLIENLMSAGVFDEGKDESLGS